MTCHAMACHVMSCHVMPCHSMLSHIMSCHAMQFHALPCHAMPSHVMSSHVMSCHVTSCFHVQANSKQHDLGYNLQGFQDALDPICEGIKGQPKFDFCPQLFSLIGKYILYDIFFRIKLKVFLFLITSTIPDPLVVSSIARKFVPEAKQVIKQSILVVIVTLYQVTCRVTTFVI